MKFKLNRHIINPELCKVVSREVSKQKIHLSVATAKNLKEIAELSLAIEKWGLPQNLICKKLPHGLGSGIFLHPKAKPIPKGQIIALYSGEIIFIPRSCIKDSLYAFDILSDVSLTKEEQLFFDSQRRYHPRRIYSLYVDAEKKGNFARFINHSETPNIIAELFKIPPNSYGVPSSPIEVVYLAKKIIKPGEQLLVSYDGDDNSYWGAMDYKPIPITPKTFQLDTSLKVVGSIQKPL